VQRQLLTPLTMPDSHADTNKLHLVDAIQCNRELHTIQDFWDTNIAQVAACKAVEAALHEMYNLLVLGLIACYSINTTYHMSWLGRRGATSTVSCR
jgi:hypothetical protein